MKRFLLLLLFAALGTTAQTTSIPDPVFEQVLIDLNIDTDGIVNGEMVTANAEAVTSLTITSLNIADETATIYDVTGLEAFVNLESLTIFDTMIEELNVSALAGLKELNCVSNLLTSLDVSNNALLEYLSFADVWDDIYPMNIITEIDLSHNPLIQNVILGPVELIDLRNGNNNANIQINISTSGEGFPPDYIFGNVCIEVDNAELAQSNGFPYSEWTVNHANMTYTYVAECTMGAPDFKNTVSVYPNPASGILYINGAEGASVQILDFSGRVVRQFDNVDGSVSLTGIAAGTYLVKMVSGQVSETKKIIIKS